MRVLNGNFNFTVKVGEDHFGGQFSYHKNGADVVKITCRKLPKQKTNGYPYEQVSYLRWVDGKWLLWDMNRRAPKKRNNTNQPVYEIFREVYGLAMLEKA